MSDYAHIVRDGIEPHPCTAEHFGVDDCQTCRNALAALDALVAERDKANADWHRMRDLHAAAIADLRTAEAEVARLKEWMACADTPLMRDVLAERDRLRDITDSFALPTNDEGEVLRMHRKVVKVYRWRVLRSQIRHQGFFFWMLRRLR